jgi:phage gp46-like protein
VSSGIGTFIIGVSGIGGDAPSLPTPSTGPVLGPLAGGDIALVWDPATGRADFAMNGGDLLMDPGLHTSVIISLFCDRLADAADVILDGTDDRRGWWGDTPLPDATDVAGGIDLTGSRLWLLARSLQLPETLRRAETYAREALQWMIDDGVAGSVTANAVFPPAPPNALELSIAIAQTGATNPYGFAFAWSAS